MQQPTAELVSQLLKKDFSWLAIFAIVMLVLTLFLIVREVIKMRTFKKENGSRRSWSQEVSQSIGTLGEKVDGSVKAIGEQSGSIKVIESEIKGIRDRCGQHLESQALVNRSVDGRVMEVDRRMFEHVAKTEHVPKE